MLHDECAPPIAQPVIDLFVNYIWETLRYLAYSPDFSLPDFVLFPKLKEPLRGTCFGSLNELPLAVTREIRYLNKKQLLNGIQKLPDRWQMCIECIDQGRDYTEGL